MGLVSHHTDCLCGIGEVSHILRQDHKVKRSAPNILASVFLKRRLEICSWPQTEPRVGGPADCMGRRRETSVYHSRGHTKREMKWTRIVRHYLCNHSLMELHLTSSVSVPDVHSSARTRGNDALMTFENQQHGELLTA